MEHILPNYPEMIESSIKMNEANSIIDIYKGEFTLSSNNYDFKVDGEIFFKWFIDSGAYFSGIPQIKLREFLPIYNKNKLFTLKVNHLVFGEIYISHFETDSMTDIVSIKGVFRHEAILGDKSIPVEKVIFSLPNFKDIHGEPVQKTNNGYITSNSRLNFENENYTIHIDKCVDYKEKIKSLEDKGGYNILYYGSLTSKKGSLNYDDIREIIYCFDIFSSFINGRRTAALFLQGIYKKEVIWTDYMDCLIDKYSPVKSWCSSRTNKGLDKLWRTFSHLWKNENDKDFLISSIHWYIEANTSLFFENSIIVTQTGLELIYNWWIVERKKMILGKDSENITAANKIRLILSQLNIGYNVPSTFTNLLRFVQNNKDILDAPDAIVQIRNAVVHSQEEKRKKINSIPQDVKDEALQLSIWYIEITLLHILDFDETYKCRLNYPCKSEMFVPWNKNNIQNQPE